MRTIEYGTPTHVPAFLTKLWKLVTDESCDELISWSPAGTSFIIFDEIRFSKELLPMYFKHNNMASFVRQLNMYGFRKLSCIDQGGMHCYRSEIEFYHQYFLKGQESLLELIKRKIPSSKSEEPKVKQEYIEELKSNIKMLKNKSESAESNMRILRRENRQLWKQVTVLTEQYSKQQVVLQQLLPFFLNMVPHREIPQLKRKAPLMIDEGSIQTKLPRLSSSYYVEHSDTDTAASMPSSPGNVSNRGPVIHDVTELESNKMYPANILCPSNTSSKESEAIVDSPLSCSLESSERNSPYTDSAVETLNILNQNFERRSPISPHMEMKPSAAASSPLHHHPSQIRAMPSPPSSRYSPSNGIPPVNFIDETTSDVPLSGSLMRSSFTHKIEDTCTDSSMFTMNGMLSKRSPIMSERSSIMPERSPIMPERSPIMPERSPMIPEETTSLLPEESTFIMSDQSRSILQDRATPIMTEQSRTMLRSQTASIMSDQSRSVLRDQSASIMNEQSRSMLQDQSVSIMNEQSRSMLQDQSVSIMNEQSRSMLQDQSVSIMNEQSRSMLQDQSVSIMNEQSRSMLQDQPASIMNDQSRSMLQDQPAPVMNDQSRSLLQSQPTSIISDHARSILREQSASIINESPRSMLGDPSVPLLPERSATILSEQAASMLPEQASMLPRIISVKSHAVLNESAQPSTSSPNKLYPSNFDLPSKNFAANGQWLLREDERIDNWLGDVFIGDNLTPGLSLPQMTALCKDEIQFTSQKQTELQFT